MRLPMQSELKSTFDQVAAENYNGVPGVIRLVAGSPSKKVVISAMTHGDEPSGLGAFRFLLDNNCVLKDVELVLAIHNIDGGARWFQATTRSDKHKCRAYGHNYNRLPIGFPEGTGGPPALERVRQLWRDVYPGTTYGLDIHSADQPLSPHGLTLDIAGPFAELERISDVIPATARFRGITPLQAREGSKTMPVGVVFGGKGGKEATALEVEADSHESPDGIRIAVQTAICMLLELGCLDADKVEERDEEQSVYDVLAATMVPGPGYRFADKALLDSFAPIKAGQVLVQGPQGDVMAKNDGCLIFAPSQLELEPGDEKEEVSFELSHRIPRMRTVRTPAWLAEL